MRLRLLIIISFCLLSFEREQAHTWTPCMPFCDTMCTGVAAVSLTANVASQYSSLSSKLIGNGQSIATLSSSFMDQQANLYSAEITASQSRIRAYDGMAKTVTITLEAGSSTYQKITDHIASEMFNIKKSERIGDQVYENSLLESTINLPTANNMLTAIPQLSEAIKSHKKRFKEASKYHLEMANTVTASSEGVQIAVLLNDIDFDIPNPFSVDEIEGKYWDEYQRFIALIFNIKNNGQGQSLINRQNDLKKQFALHALSKSLSETVKIPVERSSELIDLVGESDVTINSALFEQYKQEMMNVNTQTTIKASPVHALLVIYNLQLAQKNLLLKEIRDTKRLKNSLLAISEI